MYSGIEKLIKFQIKFKDCWNLIKEKEWTKKKKKNKKYKSKYLLCCCEHTQLNISRSKKGI